METSSKKVIIAALTGNTLIALTKFLASFFTGSSAMFSEGIHSLVDTGNQILLLFGMKRAARPADENFPFGYGKEIYFWSFVVAILIFAVGAGVSIYEGIDHILSPSPIENPLVNYIVLFLAIAFEGAAWVFAFKEFTKTKGKWGYIEAVRKGKDPTLFMVLFEDSAAILGLLVAFIGIVAGQLSGNPHYDGYASVIIGLILGGTAVWLAYETKGLLIGESANNRVVQDIRRIAGDCALVEHVNEVLTMHMGPDYLLVNLSVDFNDRCSAEQIEKAIAEMDTVMKTSHPVIKRVFIEAESRTRATSPASH
ncbi:MAG: cation diffusion facilitator family transporter [Gammaproteobacteria bacterium]